MDVELLNACHLANCSFVIHMQLHLTCWLDSWLPNWFGGWLASRQVDLLSGWLADLLASCLAVQLYDCSTTAEPQWNNTTLPCITFKVFVCAKFCVQCPPAALREPSEQIYQDPKKFMLIHFNSTFSLGGTKFCQDNVGLYSEGYPMNWIFCCVLENKLFQSG